MASRKDIHRAQVLGSGAETVVLGHGFGTDQSAWHNLTPLLVRRGYKVVLYNLVGTGEGDDSDSREGSSGSDMSVGSFSEQLKESFERKGYLAPATEAPKTTEIPGELKQKQRSFAQSFGASFRKLFGSGKPKKGSKGSGPARTSSLQTQPSISESEVEAAVVEVARSGEATTQVPQKPEDLHNRRPKVKSAMAEAAARSLASLDLNENPDEDDWETASHGSDRKSLEFVQPGFSDLGSNPDKGSAASNRGPDHHITFDFKRYTNLEAFAEDLNLLLEELGISSCLYVGHSVSGMVGVLASLQQPQKFKKLVLLAASPRYLNDEGYIGGFSQSDLDAVFESMKSNYKAWAAGFAPAAIGDANNPAVYDFTEGLLSIQPDVALAVIKMIFQSDYRHVLDKVSVPCHILQSQRDLAVPVEVAQYLHARIKGSDFEQLPVGGHLPHLSSPEIVNAALIRHLQA